MLTRRFLLLGSGLAAAGASLGLTALAGAGADESFPFTLTPEEWRARLGADQYAVLRQEATETPFTSPLLHESRKGTFACAGCDQAAFDSGTKYDSGTGWPSFWAPLDAAVGTRRDSTLGMVRTEVHCSNCGGHFGHVFNDGPKPTGLRYCMNGLALQFHAVAG